MTKKSTWWYNRTEQVGFCYDAVVGYDYRAKGNIGYQDRSLLYVYTSGGIIQVSGDEADILYTEMKGRYKAL